MTNRTTNAIDIGAADSTGAKANVLSFGQTHVVPLESFAGVRPEALRSEIELASVPEDVKTLLREYSAQSAPEQIRLGVSTFVSMAALAVAPQNRFTGEQVTAPIARLAIWAHHQHAYPLLPRLLFSKEVLNLFAKEQLQLGEIGAGTLRNYRAHLVRIGSALGVTNGFSPAPIRRDERVSPYSDNEVMSHALWARGRSSTRARVRAEMILALIVGAGLRNEEVLALRASDVIVADDVWIRVRGEHDRLVPVQAQWSPMVRKRLVMLGLDERVYPDAEHLPINHISAWLTSLKGAPQAQKLRTTWLVHHLEQGTAIDSLLAWSGIERGESLVKCLPYLRGAPSRDLHMRLMRARAEYPVRTLR